MPPTELNLSKTLTISAVLSNETKQISAVLHNSKNSIVATIQRGSSAEYYTGEYVVTPSVQEQILETRNKVMSNDVTVEEIPYYETSNEHGGYTVIIG